MQAAMKEVLWRAVEWSVVMAALCYLLLRAWTDPAMPCRTRRHRVKRKPRGALQAVS
jgi:hypothetical protein